MSFWVTKLCVNNVGTLPNNTEWIQLENNEKVERFLKDNAIEVQIDEDHIGNIYKDDESSIEIEVATVHSVKGETYTATLLMETSYYGKVESEYLIEFLKGNYPNDLIEKARHIECLKVSHVAFSRPTHLLAFACSMDNINGHEDELKKNDWEIVSVGSLLKTSS